MSRSQGVGVGVVCSSAFHGTWHPLSRHCPKVSRLKRCGKSCKTEFLRVCRVSVCSGEADRPVELSTASKGYNPEGVTAEALLQIV